MDLIKKFQIIDRDYLNNLVSNQEPESLYLDFKKVKNNRMTDKDDRKNFAKALSGYANSLGGLIIWGISTKKKNDVDYADTLSPIDDVQYFAARLSDLEGEFVAPHVRGVQHKVIYDEGNSGFVVTLIPESEILPHLAKATVNEYFRRSGSSFRAMEPFEIADIFGRRKSPNLILKVHAAIGPGPGGQKNYSLTIQLHNEGRGIAKYLLLKLLVSPPYRLSEYGFGNYNFGLPYDKNHNDRKYKIFRGEENPVIHPDSLLDITEINFSIDPKSPVYKDLRIEYIVYAEGMGKVESQIFYTASEMEELLTQI